MSRILKISAAIVIVTTVGTGLCYAETIWEKRQKAIRPEAQPQAEQKAEEMTAPEDTYNYDEEDMAMSAEQTNLDLANPFNITVPAAYGTIIDSYEGTNGKLIVHIQDAHANYEAQKNIAGIIESLISEHGINLILKEGNITDKDYTYIRERASLEERMQKADELLKKAIIAGADYLNIASDYTMYFQGIEDRQLYNENGDALLEMDKIKNPALEYTGKMMLSIDQLKVKLYNQQLLALDKAKKDYESEAIDLLGYYKILNDIIQNKNISIAEFKNFQSLMKINELEKKIDFIKINSDTATDDQKSLYKEYQDALKNLNVNKLFKEESQLESKIINSISENEAQQELVKISNAVSILDKMLKIKLVPEEYDYFLNNKKDFNPQMWADFLKDKSSELGLALNIPNNSYAISDNLPIVERFYQTAVARDNAFIKKSEEKMNKDNAKAAILISGGFHTPKLTQLLNDAGYSYIAISPRVTTKTDDELYRSTLKRELPKTE